MRNLWKPSNPVVFIGSRQAIELRTKAFGHEHLEHCLSSKKGEIWHEEGDRYKAIIFNVSKAKNGNKERYKRFGRAELEKYIKRLEISRNPKDQTPSANFFGRHIK